MGKKLIIYSFLGLCFLALLSGCENFINGANLRNELEKQIEYANTPDVSVSVTCNNSYGTILSSSSITKNTEADAYQLVKWQVIEIFHMQDIQWLQKITPRIAQMV